VAISLANMMGRCWLVQSKTKTIEVNNAGLNRPAINYLHVMVKVIHDM